MIVDREEGIMYDNGCKESIMYDNDQGREHCV